MGSIRAKLNFVSTCFVGGGSPAHPAITLRLHREFATARLHHHHRLQSSCCSLSSWLSDLYFSERGRGCGAFLFSIRPAAVTPPVVSRPAIMRRIARPAVVLYSGSSFCPLSTSTTSWHHNHGFGPKGTEQPAALLRAARRRSPQSNSSPPQSQTVLLEHNTMITTTTARPAPCVACR